MNHTKFKHTPQQKKEMYEFLDWLQENVIPGNFDMADFRENMSNDKIEVCGTSACVCGWMPQYFKSRGWEIPYDQDQCIDFHLMPRRFGIDPKHNALQWDWCFAGWWSGTDNSVEGAIARIKYLYENKLPINWRDQMFGGVKLSYTV